MVGEDQVGAAAVDVEADTEQLLRHRRALDVPARPPLPPGRRPLRVLALLVGLPEGEVERVVLALGALDALALVHAVHLAVREPSVLIIGSHAEVHVAVDGVGMLAVDQRLDVGDDRPDRLRGERLV